MTVRQPRLGVSIDLGKADTFASPVTVWQAETRAGQATYQAEEDLEKAVLVYSPKSALFFWPLLKRLLLPRLETQMSVPQMLRLFGSTIRVPNFRATLHIWH